MQTQMITCPDGVVREITGILSMPGEPDRYETADGAWPVDGCEPALPDPVAEKPAPKQRNYTRELKNALVAGAVIECAMAPYEGYRVHYSPGPINDPKPWVIDQLDDYRFSGRECRVRKEQS